MINYEKVAQKIFSIIKGHDHNLVMFTDEGMETSSAEEARRFFVSKPNYMVTLDGEARHIKINKNSNVSLEDMESIMKQLKNLATSNMLKTEIRVFGKEITPKDFAYQAKNLKEPAMENIQEATFSRMHGFKKTSYQTLESTKIIVRHRQPVEEEVHGSRARNIQAIFIEHAGERFRFPHNNLAGARAMARHINEGGEVHDPIGKYIIESISNYNKLMEFMRYARTNKLINEDSEDIVKTVQESMGVIRREIGQLQGAKTYGSMKEQIESSDVNVIEETGDDVSELQDMFTVRKFDEKIGDVLPIVKKLMDNKTAWRDALVEASEKEIAISEASAISETDIFEFDSPVQRMGYKVKDIADRMIGESDLQTFVGKVAGKLIEGDEISAFEKKIVGNVLSNAIIREEEEICEGCGELHEDCKCGPKDVVDLISDSFEFKMKMLENEDIFTEKLDEDKETWWEDDPREVMSRAYHAKRQLPPSDKNLYAKNWNKLVKSLSAQFPPPADWENPIPPPGEFERECEACWGRGHYPGDKLEPCWKCDGEGKYMDSGLEEADDHHAGEVEAGAHSGMPTGDFDVNTTDVSEIADAVIDDLAGEFDDPDMILRAITNLIGSDDPAVDDVYQEVLDKIDYREYDDGQPTEYEEWQDYMGGDDWDFGQYDENVEEDFERDRADRDYSSLAGNADCPSCHGTGANTGRKMLTHGWNCPDCKGTGKVMEGPSDSKMTDPEDFMDDCPDCGGTGKAQDSIFDDDECLTCNGEGYV